MRIHLMKLSGVTLESTMLARFYDQNRKLIAELPITADEAFTTSAVPCYWSNFRLADGPTSRRLGAYSAAFVPDWELKQRAAVANV